MWPARQPITGPCLSSPLLPLTISTVYSHSPQRRINNNRNTRTHDPKPPYAGPKPPIFPAQRGPDSRHIDDGIDLVARRERERRGGRVLPLPVPSRRRSEPRAAERHDQRGSEKAREGLRRPARRDVQYDGVERPEEMGRPEGHGGVGEENMGEGERESHKNEATKDGRNERGGENEDKKRGISKCCAVVGRSDPETQPREPRRQWPRRLVPRPRVRGVHQPVIHHAPVHVRVL